MDTLTRAKRFGAELESVIVTRSKMESMGLTLSVDDEFVAQVAIVSENSTLYEMPGELEALRLT